MNTGGSARVIIDSGVDADADFRHAAARNTTMRRIAIPLVCLLPLASPACKRVPAPTQPRESGQSGMMDETFAGKNACNPDNAERPFIIEWDATDMSSFESHAGNDVVMVKYEGCNLRVLDECRNDSIRGSQGAYKPVEWTTGSLEKINIATQGELYAKLPLGAATLGGRVAGGEKFSMEYYVAGTRNATRDAVYRDDLASNPGCAEATHFVYGYNLGAFALGSVKDFSAEAGGSLYGFGVGGKTSSTSSADKKGGDLAVCKSDSATEIAGCKAPIRLSLRKIRDGADPGKQALTAEDNSASLNAAGEIRKQLETNDAAMAHVESAMTKQGARDGKGCIAELDQHDKLNAKKASTDPKSPLANMRAICVMLSGKCDAGKQLMRKSIEQLPSQQRTPEIIDAMTSAAAQEYCEGKLDKRDELLKTYYALRDMSSRHSTAKVTAAQCAEKWEKVKKLRPQVQPRDENDGDIKAIDPSAYNWMVMDCYYKAGACKETRKAYEEFVWEKPMRDAFKDNPAGLKANMDRDFDEKYTKCKGTTL